MANTPISNLPVATSLSAGDLSVWVVSGTTSRLSWAALQSLIITNEFSDAVFRVVASADNTKEWAVDVSGVTAGQTRTSTIPNYNHALSNIPVGCLMDYAGATAPTGWLECDGSAISRTTYSALFAAIGTTWGSGDGSTTFNIPDFRGRSTIGKATGVTTEIATASSGNGWTVASNNSKWVTGMPVVLSALSGFVTTATEGPTYYVVRISSTNIRLASTLALAQNGSPDITVSGSGSVTFTYTLTARTLGEVGGEEAHAMSITELLAHVHGQGLAAGASMPVGGTVTQGNTTSTGGNAAMNIMQPFATVMKIIRAL